MTRQWWWLCEKGVVIYHTASDVEFKIGKSAWSIYFVSSQNQAFCCSLGLLLLACQMWGGAFDYQWICSSSSWVGGKGLADLSAWGHYPAESNDRRSVSQCRGRRDCNLFSVQQFAGLSVMLHFSLSETYRHIVTIVSVLEV